MREHPMNEIIKSSIENIAELIDVNKVIGSPMSLNDGSIVIPISKVIYGYGVGGSQFDSKNKQKVSVNSEIANEMYPFGGASGGGVTIKPQAIILIKNDHIKLINIDKENDVFKLSLDTLKEMFKK